MIAPVAALAGRLERLAASAVPFEQELDDFAGSRIELGPKGARRTVLPLDEDAPLVVLARPLAMLGDQRAQTHDQALTLEMPLVGELRVIHAGDDFGPMLLFQLAIDVRPRTLLRIEEETDELSERTRMDPERKLQTLDDARLRLALRLFGPHVQRLARQLLVLLVGRPRPDRILIDDLIDHLVGHDRKHVRLHELENRLHLNRHLRAVSEIPRKPDPEQKGDKLQPLIFDRSRLSSFDQDQRRLPAPLIEAAGRSST